MHNFNITIYDDIIQKAIKNFEEALQQKKLEEKYQKEELELSLKTIQKDLSKLKEII